MRLHRRDVQDQGGPGGDPARPRCGPPGSRHAEGAAPAQLRAGVRGCPRGAAPAQLRAGVRGCPEAHAPVRQLRAGAEALGHPRARPGPGLHRPLAGRGGPRGEGAARGGHRGNGRDVAEEGGPVAPGVRRRAQVSGPAQVVRRAAGAVCVRGRGTGRPRRVPHLVLPVAAGGAWAERVRGRRQQEGGAGRLLRGGGGGGPAARRRRRGRRGGGGRRLPGRVEPRRGEKCCGQRRNSGPAAPWVLAARGVPEDVPAVAAHRAAHRGPRQRGELE
mmetsp:Transcript_8913/g.25178  ORF Transcript_8913/g.25178 Transcript_8913/m.25178 type:complete len:274 (+) Transcript_8913:849-1670(+)